MLCRQILNSLRKLDKPVLDKPVKQLLSIDFAKQFPLRITHREDNAVNRKLTERVLHKLGYQPEMAGTGLEVLEALKQKSLI